MQKNIENFELRVGDIAITKISRNKEPYIEAAVLENPSLRAIFTYDTCQFVNANIPKQHLPYIIQKVRRNKRFLEK